MTLDGGIKDMMSFPAHSARRGHSGITTGRLNGCSSTCLPLNMEITPLSCDCFIVNVQIKWKALNLTLTWLINANGYAVIGQRHIFFKLRRQWFRYRHSSAKIQSLHKQQWLYTCLKACNSRAWLSDWMGFWFKPNRFFQMGISFGDGCRGLQQHYYANGKYPQWLWEEEATLRSCYVYKCSF